MSDKTKPPSKKRIEDAREEGNVAQTQSLTHLLAVAGCFELVNATSHFWLSQAPAVLSSFISRLGDVDPATRLMTKDLVIPLGGTALAGSLFALVVAALLSFIGNVVQTGIVIATKGVVRLDRLSPISHVKQWFSVEQYQNILVSSVKAVAVFTLVILGVLMSLNSLINMANGTLMQAAATLLAVVMKCERMSLVVLILFVALEWWIRKRSHYQQLKMSHDEVKRENKDQYGDPHARSGRNEFRRDIMAEQLTENTRKANVVVTNPTHFAVALLYDPVKFPLPVVLARGTQEQAAHMRRIARDNGIPIIRSVQLARALYATGRPWHPVPRLTLKAVAAVYRVVGEIKAGERDIDAYVELHDEIGNA